MYKYLSLKFLLVALSALPLTAYAACPGTVASSFTTSQVDICGPGPTTINFTNTSTGPNAATVDYEWYLNGTLFDNTTGLAAPGGSNISAVGTYTYMLIADDPSIPCLDTAIVTVIIHPVPNADFTFGPNNVCAGTLINFNNNSTGTDPYTTYNWNFGDGNFSGGTNPSHTYAAGGTYNVTLTMTNGPGCTSTHSVVVTMLDIPNVNISGDDGDGDLTYCLLPGDTTSFENVTFFNTTTGAVSYDWDFGDGSPIFTTTSNAPFVHTYTTYGTYTVTMTATHANGCTATATLTVVFEKFVSAALTLDITEYSGCAPHLLSTLQNLSVNANTYVWDFGDGTIITTTDSIPPAYAYTTGGTYTITLTASNSCNTATATISPIIIIGGPTADFTPSTTLGCAPQNVTFTNNSTNVQPANNYQWDMGNGNTYTNTTTPPAQTYDTTGTYTVTLIAGNGCGTDTIQYTIQIDTIPTVDLVALPDTGCTPLVVSSNAVATGGNLTWAWWIDGTYSYNSPNTIPNQTFTTPPGNTSTNHTILVRVTNQCGFDDTLVDILVHPAVQAIFTGNDTICEGEGITFTESSHGDSLTWAWDFGNGNTANTQGPHTETYNTAGTYTVELIVNGFCGIDTATMTVTVLPIPVADIVPDLPAGCLSDTYTFTNNSTPGGTYFWNFGPEGTPPNATTYAAPNVTFLDSGLQMITIDVNVLGCTNADTVFVDVQPLPVPDFMVTPNDGCTPLDVAFTNNTNANPGDTWFWDFGDGTTSTNQNPGNITYTTVVNDTVYDVWLIVTSSAGCVDSILQQVTVHPLPIADFTPLPDTVCALDPVGFLNNSTGASIFNWDFGDGNTSTVISPSHAYSTAGTYVVELIASTVFGCSDTITQTVIVDSIPVADFNFTIECVGTTTVFTDLSTGGILSWEWDFGDGSPLDNTQNPVHLYATAGSYNVSLTVTNLADCPVTLSQLVTVNDVPVADFTNTSTCLGQATAFTDLTTGVPISWEWDFGDGSPVDNNQHPTHLYTTVGTYTVELIVGGGSGCFDTIQQIIQVDSIPTADFTFTTVCINDVTDFTSTSTGAPDTYFWDFGDGNTDATNNPAPSHTYTTDGTYTVTLIAGYAASGCTDTISYLVDAFPRTVPAFTNNTPCLNGSTDFVDMTTNTPTTWSWNFGDGSPLNNTQNPSYVYAADGTYMVTLVTSNVFGCVDSIQQNITVYPLPTAAFTFDTVCAGFTTTFIDQSVSAVSYEWDFGDGSPVDFNPSPTHVYPAPGVYNVQQVVMNSDGCTDTIVQVVDVNPNPVADFNASIACQSYPTNFTDISIAAVTWEWDFGDGSPVNNTQNPSYTYATDGTYNVTLIVTNSFGCGDTITQAVTVLPQPIAGFVNSTVCAGASVSFTDTTFGSPNFWEWDFGDGSPLDNTQNPSHTYALGGTYTITYVAGNSAGCYDTLTTTIDVYTVPIPDFTADTVCYLNVTTFTDQSTDAVAITTWFWDFDDGNTSNSQNPTYIYQNPGTYNVSLTVTNANGCDSTVTLPVVVNDVPVAAFTFDTVCVGTPTTFTDISTGAPTAWTWDFGDGNTSTVGPVTQNTYATAGIYLASMIVDGGIGCIDQTFMVVTVSDVITAGMTVVDSTCFNDVVTLVDNSTIVSGTIVGYTWDFGDGSPIDNNMNTTHTYPSPGTYTITHTATSDGGCVSVVTQDITVLDLPVADFIATIPCMGQPTDFTDLSTVPSGTISYWEWDFGDGSPIDNTQNPSHTYALDGTYNVTLIVGTAFGCYDTITLPVQIYPQPTAAFTNTTACPGTPVEFTDMSVVGTGAIATWDWDFGDGTFDNVQHPFHPYPTTSDSFQVTLTITSDLGCVDSVTQWVVTHPIVIWDYYPTTVAGCAPLTVSFMDSSTTSGGGGIMSWLWDFDDGIMAFTQNPTHTYMNAGDYYVGLTVITAEGCTFTNQLTFPVTVYPQPIAGFFVDPGSASINEPYFDITDNSAGAIGWYWDFGDGNSSNDVNPTHTYADTGWYNIMQIVTNNFGCSDTAYQAVQVTGEFAWYAPNAFTPDGDGKNDFFFGQGYGFTDMHLMIFDRWGELIYETTDPNEGWDGTYEGMPVQVDVYVWKVKLLDIFEEQHIIYGHVTVVR